MEKTKAIFLILMLCLLFVCADGVYAFMKSDADPKEMAEMVKKSREASKIKLRRMQLEKQEAAAELENSRKIEKVEDIRPLSKKEEPSSSVSSSSVKTLVILFIAIIITFGLSLAVLKARKR